MKKILSTVILILLVIHVMATVYWVSPTGTDLATGLSRSAAWQTIAKVNTFSFEEGDIIRFKRGYTFNDDTLVVSQSNIYFIPWDAGKPPIIEYVYYDTLTYTGVRFPNMTITNLIYYLTDQWDETYAGTVFYVSSSTGNDAYPGTRAEPFLTITKANTLLIADSTTILLNSIDTFSGTITPTASGISTGNITIAAYGTTASKPVISGFTTVTGWTAKDAGDTIYYKVIDPESAPNMLTIDGVQYGMGRYPNSTNLTYESVSTNVSITDNELTGSPDWTGAEAVIYKNAYSIDRTIITDHTTTTLTYTSLGSTLNAEVSIGTYYFFQNDIKTLDQFGEWYYKSTGDTLFVYFGATDPTTVTTKVSTINNLIANTGGYDYVTIKNITFEGANQAAIKFTANTTNATVDNCNISYSGTGVSLQGTYATVTNNTISNINGFAALSDTTRSGAIFCYSPGSTIAGNTLSNIGLIPGQTKRFVNTIAITADGTNSNITNNEIDSVAYMGIYSFTNASNTLIKNNWVNRPAQLRPDAGGIYTGGTPNSNFVVEGNIVTNSGGNGIYFDNYTQHSKASGNTVFNSARNGMFINMGQYDSLMNNTLYNNGDGITYTGINLENWADTDTLRDNHIVDNIIVSDTLQTNTQLINKVVTGDAVGFWGDNHYIMSHFDSTKFRRRVPSVSNVLYKFSDWKTAVASDYTSEALPLVYGDNVIFDYNTTTANKNLIVTDSARDVAGNWYVDTTIVIAPFESIVLFKQFHIPVIPADIAEEGFEGAGYELGYGASGTTKNAWFETIGANPLNLADEDDTSTPPTGGGSQVLKTVSSTDPTATTTASRAFTVYNAIGQQSMFADLWINVDSHGLADATYATFVQLADSTSSANTAISISAYNNAGTLKWYARTYTGDALTASSATVTITEDTWYHITMKYDITNMLYGVWVGETEITSGSITGTPRVNVGKLKLGMDNGARTITVKYDEVYLDTSHFRP